MIEGKVIDTEPAELVEKALQIKHDGYRLIQICATRTKGGYELLYTFGKEYDMLHLRLNITEETEVMSISTIYEPAFLYENEIVDLFGVKIDLISLDYKGQLYHIERPTPFK